MFEELVETQPHSSSGTNRKGYFIVSGLVLFVGLSVALVFSLFAVNLNLDMNNMDMVSLVAPVDTTTPAEKLPEPEIAPKTEPKPQPGPAAAPRMTTRTSVVASLNESPREAPTAVSTFQSTEKARPTTGYFEVGKFDVDGSPDGVAGRGPGGKGTGDGEGGLGDGTAVAKVEVENEPPPPVKKDPPAPKKPLVLSLGVINGKATSLPKPSVPSAARVVNAGGTVAVHVMIDEDGNVLTANAVSGHPLLRATSEAAAKSAKFSPTLLSGSPTKVSGTINYHFS